MRAGLKTSPAVALLGPRQCGKTTLARQLAGAAEGAYFDLENPVDRARLSEPMMALESLRGLVVIDEVQHHPNLFPILRVLLDRKPVRARSLRALRLTVLPGTRTSFERFLNAIWPNRGCACQRARCDDSGP